MSEDLFYNRNLSITGTVAIVQTGRIDVAVSPSYDSTVLFAANNNSYAVGDNLFNNIPLSPNHLNANFKLTYHLGLADTQRMIKTIELMTGDNSILFEYNTGIFHPQYGYCKSYNIQHLNPRHYQVDLDFEVLDTASMMQWSGGAYMSGGWSEWNQAVSYEKFDVVYSGINGNKLNNFYYCTGDHTSASPNSPTGTGAMWTQVFDDLFEPDQGFSSNITPAVETLQFLNSKQQKIVTKRHIAVAPIRYSYSNRPDVEMKALLHFLENKQGFRRFRHEPPSLFDAPKVVYCPRWEYKKDFLNAHSLTLEFVEDPMGVIPTGT